MYVQRMLCPIGTVDDPHLNFYRKRLHLRTLYYSTYIYVIIHEESNIYVDDFIVIHKTAYTVLRIDLARCDDIACFKNRCLSDKQF